MTTSAMNVPRIPRPAMPATSTRLEPPSVEDSR